MPEAEIRPRTKPSAGGPAGPGDRGLSSTFILAAGTFAVGTDAFVVTGFLPAMASDLHVSTAAAGQSVTVFALTYALCAPVVATLTARIPRRRLLVGALLLLCLANLFSAAAVNLAMLITARMLAALGAAAFTPNAGAVSATLVPAALRARALAVVIGGLTAATALGVPLGSLASHWLSWRTVLVAVALLCLLIAAGVQVLMPSMPGGARTALRTRLAAVRRPGVLSVLPLTVLGMAACYTAYAYSVPALGAAGVSKDSASLMLFLYGLGAVLGNLLAGYFTDRRGSRSVLAVAYVLMALTLAVFAWLAGTDTALPLLVGALSLVWGASSWAQTPPQQHRLIAASPQEAPLVVSLNSSSIYLGIGLGTTVGGLALNAGFPVVFGIGAAGALAAFVLLLATTRGTRAQEPTG